LYHAYGASQIHKVISTGHAVDALSTLGTKRETAEFLSGMIAALRIVKESANV
jgi:membrane-bound lytic murein transglycosylase B